MITLRCSIFSIFRSERRMSLGFIGSAKNIGMQDNLQITLLNQKELWEMASNIKEQGIQSLDAQFEVQGWEQGTNKFNFNSHNLIFFRFGCIFFLNTGCQVNFLQYYNQLKMANLIRVLLAMMLVAANIAAPCQGDQSNLIQTGVVTISNSNRQNTRQICAVAQINYPWPGLGAQPTQATVSLAQFSYNTVNGVDYAVHAVVVNSQLNIILNIEQDGRWNSVQVSYLAETRYDVWTGTFVGDISTVFSGCVNNAASSLNNQVSTTINGISTNPSNLLIVTFIAGVRAPSGFSLSLGSPSITSSGVLTVPVTASNSVDLVYVAYAIFTTTNSPFTFNYYQVGTYTPVGSFQWVGVDHYSGASSVFYGLDIITVSYNCVGPACTASCITKTACNNAGGIISGNTCFICLPTQSVVNGQCQCPNGQAVINGACACPPGAVNVGGQCINQCGINQVWTGNGCACSPGFATYTGGACQPCPTGSVASNDRSTCVCGNGYIFDTFTVTCLANNCPPNSQPVINRGVVQCQCNTGYFFNPSTNQCQVLPQCPQGSTLNSNNQCICNNPSQIVVNNVCVTSYINSCPPNSYYVQASNSCFCTNSNEIWNQNTNQCICAQGFTRNSFGVCSKCGVNEVVAPGGCVCAPGNRRTNGICNNCPATAVVSLNNAGAVVCTCPNNQVITSSGQCGCPSSSYLDPATGQCRPNPQCPPNSNYVASTNSCFCTNNNEVYDYPSNTCQCVSGTQRNSAGQCVSPSTASCPPNSVWNPSTLRCTCTINGQYLINNICQPCIANSGWNGTQCVCKTNYFLINGVCRTCDINTFYSASQQDCVCNIGFYGNRDLCSKCDSTCGKCSGPNANQCLTCSDVTYGLVNGACYRPTPCPAGLYTDGNYCFPCSNYCATCTSLNTCSGCITGFSLTQVAVGGSTVSSCSEICGDGRRFMLPCDDGNTRNNDGCSSTCQIQTGWTCSGGTSTSKSNCIQSTTMRTIITPKGKVNTFGQVQMAVTLSSLPADLTANDCALCSDILLVKVIQSQVIPSVTVQYQPTSQFKYIVVFDFNGLISIPPFSCTLQLNPTYASSFQAVDMAQLIQVDIDPATLSKPNDNGALSLGQLSAADLNNLFNSSG